MSTITEKPLSFKPESILPFFVYLFKDVYSNSHVLRRA